MGTKYVCCIRANNALGLTLQTKYQVHGSNSHCFRIIDNQGRKGWYDRDRFEVCCTGKGDYSEAPLVPHKWAEVIHAYANGAEIQYRNTRQHNTHWKGIKNPSFYDKPHCTYRVKPEVDLQAINKLCDQIAVVERSLHDVQAVVNRYTDDAKAHSLTLAKLNTELSNLQV